MAKVRCWSKFEDETKIEQVKARLRSYRTLVSKHDACVDLYERLYPPVTRQLTHDRIQQSGCNSMESRIAAKMDMEAQMHSSLEAMQDEINGIMRMIESLPADEYVVIMRRYTLNESIETIAEKTFASIPQCWKLHRSAINRIAETV